MKHTSVMLSEAQLAQIKETGKSPSVVIREALDAYFNPVPNASELMREHERLYHMPDIAHKSRINMRDVAHEVRIDMPKGAQEMRISPDVLQALKLILSAFQSKQEPLLNEIAEQMTLSTQTLAKMLSPFEIKAQETRRHGKAGRFFTFKQQEKIQKIVDDLTENIGNLSVVEDPTD